MAQNKRIFLLACASIILLSYIGYSLLNSAKKTEVKYISPNSRALEEPKNEEIRVENSTFIFIPYWQIPEEKTELTLYDELIYFGLSATRSGVNRAEEGYKGIDSFVSVVPSDTQTFITLRMLDNDTNFDILANEKSQLKIIDDTIQIAKEKNFDGIVLDLELFSLFNDDIPAQINSFVQYFYTRAKENNLKLRLTMYGDVFYRSRPFNIEVLGKQSDGIIIMAYDLHKAIGEPGPNFPLKGKEKFGYDFTTMIDEYLNVVPPEKISVAFGMYGYDWVVDEKKRPFKRAKALSLLDIEKEFITSCEWTNCSILRDANAQENEISYVDKQSNYHIVWYEDDSSVAAKKEYLKEKRIGSTGYWVYGYF